MRILRYVFAAILLLASPARANIVVPPTGSLGLGFGVIYDFGIVGDGVTDLSSQIQNALDQLPVGSTIQFPMLVQTYIIGSTITISKPMTIKCSHPYVSPYEESNVIGTFHYTGTGSAFSIDTSSYWGGVKFDGCGISGTSLASAGITVATPNSFEFVNGVVAGFSNGTGIDLNSTGINYGYTGSRIRTSVISDNLVGLDLRGDQTCWWSDISGLTIVCKDGDPAAIGIHLQTAVNPNITQSTFHRCKNGGVSIKFENSIYNTGAAIHDILIQNYGDGITGGGTSNTGVHIYNVQFVDRQGGHDVGGTWGPGTQIHKIDPPFTTSAPIACVENIANSTFFDSDQATDGRLCVCAGGAWVQMSDYSSGCTDVTTTTSSTSTSSTSTSSTSSTSTTSTSSTSSTSTTEEPTTTSTVEETTTTTTLPSCEYQQCEAANPAGCLCGDVATDETNVWCCAGNTFETEGACQVACFP